MNNTEAYVLFDVHEKVFIRSSVTGLYPVKDLICATLFHRKDELELQNILRDVPKSTDKNINCLKNLIVYKLDIDLAT